jgi:acyl carrier protein
MPEKFIVAVAEALDKNVASMTLTDRFKEYEEWDSLAVLAVMAGLEESYNVVLSRHDLDRCETLQDLFGVVDGKSA